MKICNSDTVEIEEMTLDNILQLTPITQTYRLLEEHQKNVLGASIAGQWACKKTTQQPNNKGERKNV